MVRGWAAIMCLGAVVLEGCGLSLSALVGERRIETRGAWRAHPVEVTTMPEGGQVLRADADGVPIYQLGAAPVTDAVHTLSVAKRVHPEVDMLSIGLLGDIVGAVASGVVIEAAQSGSKLNAAGGVGFVTFLALTLADMIALGTRLQSGPEEVTDGALEKNVAIAYVARWPDGVESQPKSVQIPETSSVILEGIRVDSSTSAPSATTTATAARASLPETIYVGAVARPEAMPRRALEKLRADLEAAVRRGDLRVIDPVTEDERCRSTACQVDLARQLGARLLLRAALSVTADVRSECVLETQLIDLRDGALRSRYLVSAPCSSAGFEHLAEETTRALVPSSARR